MAIFWTLVWPRVCSCICDRRFDRLIWRMISSGTTWRSYRSRLVFSTPKYYYHHQEETIHWCLFLAFHCAWADGWWSQHKAHEGLCPGDQPHRRRRVKISHVSSARPPCRPRSIDSSAHAHDLIMFFITKCSSNSVYLGLEMIRQHDDAR